MKAILTLVAALILPNSVKPAVLGMLGHKVHQKARIGTSLIWRTRLHLGERARIGSFNYIACRILMMRADTILGWGNVLRGPFKLRSAFRARIGNRNIITCPPRMAPGRPCSLLWL